MFRKKNSYSRAWSRIAAWSILHASYLTLPQLHCVCYFHFIFSPCFQRTQHTRTSLKTNILFYTELIPINYWFYDPMSLPM